jgi:hypothetical protein
LGVCRVLHGKSSFHVSFPALFLRKKPLDPTPQVGSRLHLLKGVRSKHLIRNPSIWTFFPFKSPPFHVLTEELRQVLAWDLKNLPKCTQSTETSHCKAAPGSAKASWMVLVKGSKTEGIS